VDKILIQLFDNEYVVKNVGHMNVQDILMINMIFHLLLHHHIHIVVVEYHLDNIEHKVNVMIELLLMRE
jgi:hypothetical protein